MSESPAEVDNWNCLLVKRSASLASPQTLLIVVQSPLSWSLILVHRLRSTKNDLSINHYRESR